MLQGLSRLIWLVVFLSALFWTLTWCGTGTGLRGWLYICSPALFFTLTSSLAKRRWLCPHHGRLYIYSHTLFISSSLELSLSSWCLSSCLSWWCLQPLFTRKSSPSVLWTRTYQQRPVQAWPRFVGIHGLFSSTTIYWPPNRRRSWQTRKTSLQSLSWCPTCEADMIIRYPKHDRLLPIMFNV